MNRSQANEIEETTKLVFDQYFLVRVQSIQSTSVEYMQRYGNYTTMDRDIDKELSKQWTTTMMPIHLMVDHYRNGGQIKVVKSEDTKVIYESISRHLEAWRRRLEFALFSGDAPVEDLLAMDVFANDVYEHAKFHFTQDTVDSYLAGQLRKVSRFNATNFFTEKPKELLPEVIEIDNQSDELPLEGFQRTDTTGRKHYSLGEFLRSKMPMHFT